MSDGVIVLRSAVLQIVGDDYGMPRIGVFEVESQTTVCQGTYASLQVLAASGSSRNRVLVCLFSSDQWHSFRLAISS